MSSSLRTSLALLRLLLIFALLCLLAVWVVRQQRAVIASTIGQAGPLPSTPAPGEQPFLGVTVELAQYTAAQQRRVLANLHDAGFGWVRIRLGWEQLEPSSGQYVWASADQMINAVVDAGLLPVLLLDGSPAWARAPQDQGASANPFAPPADPRDFARFAGAVAARYGASVRHYQIWDEPNIAPHWGTRLISPIGYARLLKATAPAIRAADADAFILLAALAPTADRGHIAIDESYFLQRLYAADAAPAFDAVAVQPFGFGARPLDDAIDVAHLNFQRTRLIRQTMLDAGDGTTPIWIVRFGWNRDHGSTWGTVTPADQVDFTLTALDTAYFQWPWVTAMGWAIDQPDAPLADPVWGFALSPSLTAALRAWVTQTAGQPRTSVVMNSPRLPQLILWSILAAMALLVVRGGAAARLLPWSQWRTRWRSLPPWLLVLAWTILLYLYYLATWPPFIVGFWLLAALGFMAHPRLGLALAVALLPLYNYHKELRLAEWQIAIPPTQAVLLCLLPAVWHDLPQRTRIDRWDWLALTWAVAMLLGATGGWVWSAYVHGAISLVLVPLALFRLIRSWIQTPQQSYQLVTALVIGGLIAALIGLVDWLNGGGTIADGIRRLVGVTFSPNHTALYLERVIFVAVGLWALTHGWVRWSWAIITALLGIALLLTGSRGALLLGLPVGMLLFALLLQSRPGRQFPLRMAWSWGIGLAVVGMITAAALGWDVGDRLGNSASVRERWSIWRLAFAFWQDYPLFGVGPGGFFWRFPAYLPLTSTIDPNLRHPHNVWLEFATSGGLLALAWLAAAVANLALLVRRTAATLAWPQIGLLAGLAAAFAHAQVDAFQSLPDLAAWNWCALALLLAPWGMMKDAAAEKSGTKRKDDQCNHQREHTYHLRIS